MEIYCCLQGLNLLSLPELGGFSHLTEHSTALERNQNILTTLHHLHLFGRQGQVPWTMSQVMERILSKVHQLEEPGQAGPGRFPTPGTSTSVSLVVRSPQLSCSPSSRPPGPALAAATGPSGSRWSCSGAEGCSAPLWKTNPGKHQEKPSVWLIFLLQKRAPRDTYL